MLKLGITSMYVAVRKGDNMGKKNRKKNKASKRNNKTSTVDKKKSAKELLEEQEAKIQADQLKHLASKRKIHNVFDSITDVLYGIGKILFLLILGGLIAGLLIFFGWAMWAYASGNNTVANVTMTIMQALSGLVSVVVGIWALVLTIKANKKQNVTESRLNINRSISGVGIPGVPDTKDVNPNSL